MRPALLVVDVQNAFLDEEKGLKDSVDKRCDVINEAIRLFREKRLPIIVVYHTDKDGPEPGTIAFEFYSKINVQKDDVRVVKNYPNAFNKTQLREVLRKEGCDSIVIVGLSAVGCCLATFHGAIDHDIEPYFVRDGVCATTENYVKIAEEICRNRSVDELKTMF